LIAIWGGVIVQKWKIRYARSADADKITDCAIVDTEQFNHMKKLPWIKIFSYSEEPKEAKTGLLYSDYENLMLSWQF